MPSAPIIAGVAALAISTYGAVTAAETDIVRPVSSQPGAIAAAGSTSVASVSPFRKRETIVSRDSRRDAMPDAANEDLVAQTEAQADLVAQTEAQADLVAQAAAQAEQQQAALQQFAKAAEKQAAKIKENQWVLPLDEYRITAPFGASGYLWATVHTGLDMAAPDGTPISSVANGIVTEAGYAGSYGYRTVVTLEDGTEIWYNHQNSILVSVGDVVRGGDVIGTVGSTGNSTGNHLHIEVRPGAGDPIDPVGAFLERGITL